MEESFREKGLIQCVDINSKNIIMSAYVHLATEQN